MAITKSNTNFSIQGNTTSATSSAIDCSGSYATEVYVQIDITVAIATAAPSFYVLWSSDGTNYFQSNTFATGTAIGTYWYVVSVPVSAEKVEVNYAVGTVGASGVHTLTRCQLGQVTAI